MFRKRGGSPVYGRLPPLVFYPPPQGVDKKTNIPLVFNSFLYFALITVKSEKYGKIHQSLYRCRFQAHLRASHPQRIADRFPKRLVNRRKTDNGHHILDKELLPDFSGDRGVIYDIYCTNEDGEQFIVEMQNREQTFFRERALYYLSQAIARQG